MDSMATTPSPTGKQTQPGTDALANSTSGFNFDLNQARLELLRSERRPTHLEIAPQEKPSLTVASTIPAYQSPVTQVNGAEPLAENVLLMKTPFGSEVKAPISGEIRLTRDGGSQRVTVASLTHDAEVSISGLRGTVIEGTRVNQGDTLGHQSLSGGIRAAIRENGTDLKADEVAERLRVDS
jgi:hypothetical protein